MAYKSLIGNEACEFCFNQFHLEYNIPIVQPCNHSICHNCLHKLQTNGRSTPPSCPIDNETIDFNGKFVNQTLLRLLFGRGTITNLYGSQSSHLREKHALIEIENQFGLLALYFRENFHLISPQQRTRLSQLLNVAFQYIQNRQKLINNIASVFNRLILELIQAHYNTKQREDDVKRHLDSKNCYIREPELTDAVISLLVQLYNAAGQCTDTSFERKVLTKFLTSKLGAEKEHNIKKIVQTLLWSNCFNVSERAEAPSRYSLKEHLQSGIDLRRQHDIEIIRKVRDKNNNSVRLTPRSWAHLLHGNSSSEYTSQMQSILDKHLEPLTVKELHETIRAVGDMYTVWPSINLLESLQMTIQTCLSHRVDFIKLDTICDILRKFVEVKHLLTLRQCRLSYILDTNR